MDHYQKVKKVLTDSDVDRLVLNRELCVIMGREMEMLRRASEERERVDPPPIVIKALDDQGDIYHFNLSGRTVGPYLKPVFQAGGGWGDFVRKRDAQAGHTIYFCKEKNASKGTDYRIDFFPFKCYLSPYPEGLSSSQPSAPAEETGANLKIWAARGLAL